jgi:GNAT superfamily N-acetyltransferase
VSEPTAEPAYHEPARGYATVFALLAIFAGGCVADVLLTGREVHLVGWSVAAVVVCGIMLVATKSARVFRSITVTEDEITVGESSIDRSAILGVDEKVDPNTPVLGQRLREGMPRGVPGLTLRLADGALIAVPTRHPVQLASVLDLPNDSADIRPVEENDADALDDIERRAIALYRVAGLELPTGWTSTKLGDTGVVFVSGRPAEGFVRLGEVDGCAHLVALAVVPPRIRHGLGSQLLERAFVWARANGYSSMVASTFADVEWNAPFLAAHGFVEEPGEPSPGMAEVRDWEHAIGMDSIGRRVVMRKVL